MPTYEYECPGGDYKVELNLPYNHDIPKCDTCGADMVRIYSAPAVQFKGTGFYSTGG